MIGTRTVCDPYLSVCVFYIQGLFTHWEDTSSVFDTNWYNPRQHHFIERQSHVYRDGFYMTMKTAQSQRINYTSKQPVYSPLYNCTATIMDAGRSNYPWVTIPCDEKYRVSYFCQPLHMRGAHRTPIQPPNYTCNDNWLLPIESETCLLLLDNNSSKISYFDSQQMCSLYNATVFNVNASDRVDAVYTRRDLKGDLLHGVEGYRYKYYQSNRQKLFTKHLTGIQNMSTVNIKNMLFGRRLSRIPYKSMIPHSIFYVASEIPQAPNHMSFFAHFNHTCSVVEKTTMSYAYADASYPGDEWGVKCRPCSKRIKVSGTICEKPAELYVVRCQRNHFECGDKTCVLSIYKCDHIVDCLDHSDESGCIYGLTSTLTDQFVHLPCVQSGICSTVSQVSVHVHAICDGLYNNNTFSQEQNVCKTFNFQKNVPALRAQRNPEPGEFTFQLYQLFQLCWQEKKYFCSKLKNTFSAKTNITDEQDIFFPERLTTQNTILNDACIFSRTSKRCYSQPCVTACELIACPGMFKCLDHFCILLSLVCDKIYDCRLGEDEVICNTLTCPGSLKCRGENKCISTDEICDKHVNCLYSMDDEMGCDACPDNCECRGYVASCYPYNTDFIIQNGELLYTKGLVIKGIHNVLITKYLKSIGLLFLNMSSCKLSKIDVSHNVSTQYFILIADFSHNQLTDIDFIEVETFNRVLFLDISFNFLINFRYGHFLSLRYLSAIYLRGNKLKQIEMTVNNNHLELIDLQFVYYSPDLVINIYQGIQFDLLVKVSDSKLCCMFSNDIKCVSKEKYIICNGLFDTISTKVVFYIVSLLSLFISIITLSKQALQIIPNRRRQKLNQLNSIMLLNQSIVYILSSVYLASLAVLDILKIQLLTFNTSIMCNTLNAMIYISLESIIVFKSGLCGLISLKLKFPFNHQCTWLKWMIPASCLVCALNTAIYIIHMFLPFARHNQPVFDNLCSVGWCGMNTNFNMLHIMIYIVDQVMVLNYVASFITIYKTLRARHNTVGQIQSGKRYTAGVITCKLICVNIFEILLRVYLITMLSIKFAHLRFVNFCLYFVLYALPINILYSCIINCFSQNK